MPKITYTDEFKRDAVALVASGIPQKQVAKDMGMAKTTLQAWVRDARFQSHGMTPTSARTWPRRYAGSASWRRRTRCCGERRRICRRLTSRPQNDLPAREGDGCGRCPGEGAGGGRVSGVGILQAG